MNRKMTENELLACFEDELKSGHIYAVYQPKINHDTGRMIGAEALMRWSHPEYGKSTECSIHQILFRCWRHMT